MSTSLRLKDSTGNLQQFSDSDEFWISNKIGKYLALDSIGPGTLGSSVGGGSNTVGTFTNTFFNEAVGTAPGTAISSGSTTSTLYQRNGAAAEGDYFPLPVEWLTTDSGVYELTSTRLNTQIDRYASKIFTRDFAGSYRLSLNNPSNDSDGTDYFQAVANIFNDTRTDGTSLNYSLWKRQKVSNDSSDEVYSDSAAIRPLMLYYDSAVEFTNGVTKNGVPGNSGAYTDFTVPAGVPDLYYYCEVHSEMGGTITGGQLFTKQEDANGVLHFTVVVENPGSGNVYKIDSVRQQLLVLQEGETYRFDQSDNSNSSHPLQFSTTDDGSHGGGSEYTTGVTKNGVAGNAGAYVEITVATGAPKLYYYCGNHSGMGFDALTPAAGVVAHLSVTVANPGSGNKFYIGGHPYPSITLREGDGYRFDQSNFSNSGHPFRVSKARDGTHAGPRGNFAGFMEMADSDINASLVPRMKSRIVSSGIGTYQLRTSAQGVPTDAGTWVAKGSATDTKQQTGDVNYTRSSVANFTSTYTQSYTNAYEATYVSVSDLEYTNAYDGAQFARDYTASYTSDYEGVYTTAFQVDYTGATYVGTYTAVYAGTYTGNYETAYANFPFQEQYASIADYTGPAPYTSAQNYTNVFIGNLGYTNVFTTTTNFTNTFTSSADYNRVFNYQANFNMIFMLPTWSSNPAGDRSFVPQYPFPWQVERANQPRGPIYSYSANFNANYVRNFQGRARAYSGYRRIGYVPNYTREFIGYFDNSVNYNRVFNYQQQFARVDNYTNVFTDTANYTTVFTGDVNYESELPYEGGGNYTDEGDEFNYTIDYTHESNINYTSNFEVDYIANFGVPYTGDYTGIGQVAYDTAYQTDYTGTYTTGYTTDYEGNYDIDYDIAYDTGYDTAYEGNYVGDFAGETILNTSAVNETYTLYVKIAA